MNIIVLGAGMMGKAIAYDLCKYSNFKNITITDKDRETLDTAKKFLDYPDIDFNMLNIEKIKDVREYFKKNDIMISAVPYIFNHTLTKIAIETQTHLLDLGGNNDIVGKQRNLFSEAKQKDVTIIPDCGLAPGMTSVITRDLVETMDIVNNVKIRVGGLPINPKPPLNYQIVFSPNGLINEYIEDAIVLENGKIIQKKSMTELEEIIFPKPFGKLEAFLTSGGCSTLPYTYKDKIKNLDYKTIRYLGHCEKFKPLFDIKPREKLIAYLLGNLPLNEKDVVLSRVSSQGIKDSRDIEVQYTIIDYYDNINNITSMMRTTAYPTSIIAQMIEREEIKDKGVFCCEEIVPCSSFFKELEKRNIKIHKEIKK